MATLHAIAATTCVGFIVNDSSVYEYGDRGVEVVKRAMRKRESVGRGPKE
jgi:hypothetical protein